MPSEKLFQELSDGNGGTLTYTLEGIKKLPEREFRQYQFYRDLDLRKAQLDVQHSVDSINSAVHNIQSDVFNAIEQHKACPLLQEQETLVEVAKETRFTRKLKKKIRGKIIFWSLLFATVLNLLLIFLHSQEVIKLF